jgi:hypothetical protein
LKKRKKEEISLITHSEKIIRNEPNPPLDQEGEKEMIRLGEKLDPVFLENAYIITNDSKRHIQSCKLITNREPDEISPFAGREEVEVTVNGERKIMLSNGEIVVTIRVPGDYKRNKEMVKRIN